MKALLLALFLSSAPGFAADPPLPSPAPGNSGNGPVGQAGNPNANGAPPAPVAFGNPDVAAGIEGNNGPPGPQGNPNQPNNQNNQGLNPPPANNANNPQPNRATDWQSVTNNNSMFNGSVPTTATVRQADSYAASSNSFTSCVQSSTFGRSDGDCATNPDHPECVGFNRAVDSATSAPCLQYAVPASLGCLVYAPVNGYTAEEWFAFSDQYFSSMSGCFQGRDQNDPLVDKMLSMSDMLTKQEADYDGSGKLDSHSGVSGSTKSSKGNSKDGSLYLGYEEGEVFRRARAGQNFFDVLSDSPVAKGMTEEARKKTLAAVTDSAEVTEKALERQKKLLASDEQKSDKPEKTAKQDVPAPAAPAKPAGTSSLAAAKPPALPTPKEKDTLPTKSVSQPLLASLPAPSGNMENNDRRPSSAEAERFAELAMTTLQDISLFQRVNGVYKKKAPGMNKLEMSETGRAIKSMETPQFFKSL